MPECSVSTDERAIANKLVLLPNSHSMCKLIHNRCTCKLVIKTTAECVYANEQLSLTSGRLGEYSPVFTEPEANN